MTQESPEAGDPELTRPVAGASGSDGSDAEATVAIGGDSPTVTGPTIAGWPGDQTDGDLPGELVWQSDPHPSFDNRRLRETRSPGYYASLGAAVVVVVGLVATLAVLTVTRPTRSVGGTAVPTQGLPEITPPSSAAPPSSPTASTTPALDQLAEHPLSTSSAVMGQSTCALPKFDPADEAQATFYDAAKACADAAWRDLLPAAGLPAADVAVVTVIGDPAQTACGGEVAPTDPATQCQGTVYLTPAYLRDDEGNDRYPGKYFGVFLREYAEAVQFGTGLTELYGEAAGAAGADKSDLERRLAQQATCLAGISSGAMAGLGAVDTNITNEIRDRLTTVDAPPDAAAWLTAGFESRQPATCNSWTN